MKRLTRIGPLKAGIILGILYAILGLLFAPFFLFMAIFGKTAGAGGAMVGVAMAVFIPIIYGVAGFLGGALCAFLYNLIAKWTGGLEFETAEGPTQQPRAHMPTNY